MIEPNRDAIRQATAPVCSSDYCLRLNSVLDSTCDLVMAVNRDWVVSYANRGALNSFPDLKIGDQYWSTFPSLAGTAAEKYQREAMEWRSEVQYEALYSSHDKRYTVNVYPMEEGISIFLKDVTDEKAFGDKLSPEQLLRERRIEALSHMAGGLAHEISNPLAIIHGWAHDLKKMAGGKQLLPSREIDTVCDKILKTTDRACNIIRGLKAFGRDAGHDPLEPASIYTILDQALELQESRFSRHNVEIRTHLQSDIPPFPCREVQIAQILTNLLNNAFDAIVQSDAQERWVSVTAVFASSEICVEVSDSGPGIPEQQKKHLMKPFFTTKELGLGMGIGLSLSRAIAQSHGGTLTLMRQSEPTCFRLCLPAPFPTERQKGSPHSVEEADELEQG